MEQLRNLFNLQRFVDAQHDVIESVRAELRGGRKLGHWMWFIFPQLRGLGRTPTSQHYGISSVDEAVAYLRHPVLGSRLIECTELVNAINGKAAVQIFGDIDAMKFRSCMTLFAKTDPENPAFTQALDRYYAGEADELTLDLLGSF